MTKEYTHMNPKTEEKFKRLIALLESHDWYYQMSDDYRVYERGDKALLEIKFLVAEIENEGWDAQRICHAYRDIHYNPAYGHETGWEL